MSTIQKLTVGLARLVKPTSSHSQANNTHAVLLIIFLYTLSYGLMLFNPGIYWDDWTLIHNNRNEIIDTFTQAGSPWSITGHLHAYLIHNFSGVEIYRYITFFCYLISGLCVYKTLNKINFNKGDSSLLITLLFLIAPINNARIALINTPYAICFFAFYLALFLFIHLKRNIISELIFTFLFLLSFNTASLLPFFFAILLPYFFYIEAEKNKKKFLQTIRKNIRLLMAPFYFFALKNFIW
jgi:hypothetical protein